MIPARYSVNIEFQEPATSLAVGAVKIAVPHVIDLEKQEGFEAVWSRQVTAATTLDLSALDFPLQQTPKDLVTGLELRMVAVKSTQPTLTVATFKNAGAVVQTFQVMPASLIFYRVGSGHVFGAPVDSLELDGPADVLLAAQGAA